MVPKLTLNHKNKDVVVFWGSQSGTAEGFANRLSRELFQRLRLSALSADLSDFDSETLAQLPQSKLAIFIVSTYGEGDPSDNATQFWDWITKQNQSELQSLRYFAFGLGNSNYQHYNRVVHVVDQCLLGTGAQRLLPPGKADDANGGTEVEFCNWKSTLFAYLVGELGFEEQDPKYEATLETVYDTSLDIIDLHTGEPTQGAAKSNNESAIKPVHIKSARELFKSGERNCLHLEVSLSDHPELVYKTGDHIGIWASSPDEEVDRLIRVLGLLENADTPLSILSIDPAVKVHVPTPTTVTTLFRYYIEICCPVSRELARSIAEFAPSLEAKAWLKEITNSKEVYASFVKRTHVNFGRLCELALSHGLASSWVGLPLTYLLENLPRMRPRYYSISSSSVLSPKTVAITALVSNTMVAEDENSIPGLATNYLLANSSVYHGVALSPRQPSDLRYNLSGPSSILDGGKIFAHLRRSTFKLPALSKCPLIMIAAGTGIAPFRAFIAERARFLSMGRSIGDMILFFGCRNPEEDYIYREEIKEFKRVLGDKLQVVEAFSRGSGPKQYVQDKVLENGDYLDRLIQDDASIYACGRASMAKDAGKALGFVIGRKRQWNGAQIQEWTASMKRTRKWQEDVWG